MSTWNELMLFGLLLIAGVVSYVLTGFFRLYALKKNLLDIPGQRSSHTVPTPRGGGLAIVLVMTLGLMLMWWADGFAAGVMPALLGAGSLVALIGWLDDHGHVAAKWRLLIHFIAAGWALAWLGGLPALPVFGHTLDLGWIGHILAALYLVWLLNLYNFMDGIDGIAGIEAITVSLGGALLFWFAAPEALLWQVPALLLVTVSGFLLWNFPRARIFMGDVGSGFLGMILGIFSFQAAWISADLFWGWVILLGAFITDATVTLIRRLLQGENISQAHRNHAYQHAARMYGSHVPVSLAFGIINILWLLPLSIVVGKGLLDGVLGVLIAYLPLIVLAIRFKGGIVEVNRGHGPLPQEPSGRDE